MTSTIAAARTALSRIVPSDNGTARTILRIAGKVAVLMVMALTIAAYAVSPGQSAPPPPDPAPFLVYS